MTLSHVVPERGLLRAVDCMSEMLVKSVPHAALSLTNICLWWETFLARDLINYLFCASATKSIVAGAA